MTDAIAKADDFKKQAEKKLKGFGFFGNKYEDAAELYEKAANQYKLAKCWADAADCFARLAECYIKCDSKHEAASNYVEASKMAAKSKPQSAIELLHRAVGLYTEMGRLNQAARVIKEIAETNEKQGAKDEAITFYEQASDLYETEGSSSEATKCKLKVAEFSAERGDYRKAQGLFEDAAKRAVENNLLKFSARGYLLNAGICGLCFQTVDEMLDTLSRYRDIDLQFQGSREDTLLQGLCDAFEKGDEGTFATHLAEFDAVIRLDAWKTKILLAAKRRLKEMAEEEDLGIAKPAARGNARGAADEDDDLR